MAKFNPSLDVMGMLRDTVGAKPIVRMLALEQLSDNPANFFSLDDGQIDGLAQDIRENGLLHNLVVQPKEGAPEEYWILSGHRRKRAYERLRAEEPDKYAAIPCQVRTGLDAVDAETILLVANTQVRELTNEEKRRASGRLMELLNEKRRRGELKGAGKTRDIAGQQLGMSGKTITQLERINRQLIPELQALFDSEKMTINSAFNAAALDEEQQRELYKLLISAGERVTEKQSAELQKLIQEREMERRAAAEALARAEAESTRAREEAESEKARAGALEARVTLAEAREKELERLRQAMETDAQEDLVHSARAAAIQGEMTRLMKELRGLGSVRDEKVRLGLRRVAGELDRFLGV